MKLYVKTCSNLQSLSIKDQKTLMKRFVSTALWPLVELGRGDEMGTMIKKVVEAYDRQNHTFSSPERSKSGAMECWECNEVVTGDHYQHNCPKKKNKEDESRPMTSYPRRDRTN